MQGQIKKNNSGQAAPNKICSCCSFHDFLNMHCKIKLNLKSRIGPDLVFIAGYPACLAGYCRISGAFSCRISGVFLPDHRISGLTLLKSKCNDVQAEGVRAEYLESVFPAESFPAWQSLQTGLYLRIYIVIILSVIYTYANYLHLFLYIHTYVYSSHPNFIYVSHASR